jgi:hypothetical protein
MYLHIVYQVGVQTVFALTFKLFTSIMNFIIILFEHLMILEMSFYFFSSSFLGDGLTVPTKFSHFERQGEMKTPSDRKPRTDISAFENGGESIYC